MERMDIKTDDDNSWDQEYQDPITRQLLYKHFVNIISLLREGSEPKRLLALHRLRDKFDMNIEEFEQICPWLYTIEDWEENYELDMAEHLKVELHDNDYSDSSEFNTDNSFEGNSFKRCVENVRKINNSNCNKRSRLAPKKQYASNIKRRLDKLDEDIDEHRRKKSLAQKRYLSRLKEQDPEGFRMRKAASQRRYMMKVQKDKDKALRK